MQQPGAQVLGRDVAVLLVEQLEAVPVGIAKPVGGSVAVVALDPPLPQAGVESDDQYLAILRLDEGEDLRVFGSDSAFADESRIGSVLLGEIEAPGARDRRADRGAGRGRRRLRRPTRTPIRSATPNCSTTSASAPAGCSSCAGSRA